MTPSFSQCLNADCHQHAVSKLRKLKNAINYLQQKHPMLNECNNNNKFAHSHIANIVLLETVLFQFSQTIIKYPICLCTYSLPQSAALAMEQNSCRLNALLTVEWHTCFYVVCYQLSEKSKRYPQITIPTCKKRSEPHSQ